MSPKYRLTVSMMAVLVTVLVAWHWLPGAKFGRAPDVSFITLAGERMSLSSLRGRPVLVTFWATNCPHCINDIGNLISLHRELGPRGLKIVAVVMPYDPPNRVLQMARAREIPYTIALDLQGRVLEAFEDVPGTPTTFLIGPDGTIAQRSVGPLNVTDLTERILAIVEEA